MTKRLLAFIEMRIFLKERRKETVKTFGVIRNKPDFAQVYEQEYSYVYNYIYMQVMHR